MQKKDILRSPYSSDIGALDPDNGFEVTGLTAMDSLYEGLVKYETGSTRIVGSLAKSWEISGDGLIEFGMPYSIRAMCREGYRRVGPLKARFPTSRWRDIRTGSHGSFSPMMQQFVRRLEGLGRTST